MASTSQSRAASNLKPFLLYTGPTPNGHKVSIFLEELKIVYGIKYDIYKINIVDKTWQTSPWFTKLNLNGRIPVLIDRNRDDFPIFETAAIILYLQQHYDPLMKFSYGPDHPKEQSEILQWTAFGHGGVGPTQERSMAYHFEHTTPDQPPYWRKRDVISAAGIEFKKETLRLYGVLETRLQDRDWLVGPGRGTYSIADMNVLPWVRVHKAAGIESIDSEFPRVAAWLKEWRTRSAVKVGLLVGRAPNHKL